MKKRGALALALAVCLLLEGCSSMLERDYSVTTVHSAAPAVDTDQLAIRVESYQDLVNALLYLIAQSQEEGTVRLYNYPYDVEQGLADACAEVTQEDPLGAYAVQRISYDVTPIVSCYEAAIRIYYRRTQEQTAAIVSATGASAIRRELRRALAQFQTEAVLRVNYFEEGEDYIQTLIREAYCANPETAVELPRATVYIYPEGGQQHILEILLRYRSTSEALEQKQEALSDAALELSDQLWGTEGDEGLLEIRRSLLERVEYDPGGESTAYHALVEGSADSLGLALAMSLLCQNLDFSCTVVEGTLDGEAHAWNIVSTQDGGHRHLDLSRPDPADSPDTSPFLTDRDLYQAGYRWDMASVPQCGEQPETAQE